MKKLLTILAFIGQFLVINAQSLYLTDGNGEARDNIFLSNQSDGVFITGCTGASLFNPCNLFIIPNTTTADLDGDTLIDVFASRNTIASFMFCGGVVDLLIHAINPSQPNTFIPGKYDIVLDMNQDSYYNSNTDVLLGNSLDDYFFEIVNIPHDTALTYPVNQAVLASKSFALREAQRINNVDDDSYYNLVKNSLSVLDRIDNLRKEGELNQELLEDIYNLVQENKTTLADAYEDGAAGIAVKIASSYLLSGDALPSGGSTPFGKVVNNYYKYIGADVLEKVKHAINASRNMYIDIAADPPRNDYNVLEDVLPNISYGNDLNDVDFFFKSDKTAIAFYQLLEIETATERAYLKTLERLQGAKINNQLDYLRFQNQHLRNLVNLLIQIKDAEIEIAQSYKSSNRIGTPISKDSIKAHINRIQTNGFPQSVIDDALNRGVTMPTINKLKDKVIAFDTANITYGTTWEDTLLVGYNQSKTELNNIKNKIDSLEQLFMTSGISYPFCLANINGPDSAIVNQNFSLSTSFTNSQTSAIQHWKPNNTFGMSTNMVEQIPGYFLYQVTNKNAQGGVLNRAFKLMHIVMPNFDIPLKLDTTNFYAINEGDTLNLKTQQNPSDANGLIVSWSLDGSIISGANQNTYEFIAPNLGAFSYYFKTISCRITHPGYPQLQRNQTWVIKVKPKISENVIQPDTLARVSNINTGVNELGVLLPIGSKDLNWKYSEGNTIEEALYGTYDSAFVCGRAHGNWLVPSINANWISTSPGGGANEKSYASYKCNFIIPDSINGEPFSNNFILNIDFAWDDYLDEIYVNGIPQSAITQNLQSGGLSIISSASLDNNWHPGNNELILLTRDIGVVEGLLAQLSFNTPVFIISYNTPVQLNSSDTEFCNSSSITIIADSIFNATYKWYKNGIEIPNFSSSSIQISDTGTYKAAIYIQGNFILYSDSIKINSCHLGLICTGSFGEPIVNIDFGTGSFIDLPTAVPNATTNYGFVQGFPLDGSYTIYHSTALTSSWVNSPDHTDDNLGRMLIINADANQAGEFYRQKVANLCSGTTYKFSAWITSIIRTGWNGQHVNVKFEVLDASNNTSLEFINTGELPIADTAAWKEFSFEFTTNSDSIILLLKNNGLGGSGNDLAIDDITFRACSGGNTLSAAAPSMVCNNTEVTLDGNVTSTNENVSLDFQWQKLGDDATTWIDIPNANTLNYTISNFTRSDTGTYRLTAANSGNISSPNCRFVSNTTGVHIQAYPLPIASFTASINGSVVNGSNTSQNTTSQIWTFGDGTTDTSLNPIHTYTQDGDFTITLHAMNTCGEIDTQSQHIIICGLAPKIEILGLAKFCDTIGTYLKLTTCQSGSIKWYKDGVVIPNQINDSLAVKSSGTYTCEVTYNTVVRTSDPIVITSVIVPVAIFNIVQNNNQLVFTNTSQNSNEYHWNFGDNTISALENPSHIYSGTGNYTVILSSYNDICVDTFQKLITVQIISGIRDNVSNGIAIYPNPASQYIQINSNDVIKYMSIVDLSGRIVKQVTPNQNSVILNIEDLANGLYMLDINNGEAVTKFIKN